MVRQQEQVASLLNAYPQSGKPKARHQPSAQQPRTHLSPQAPRPKSPTKSSPKAPSGGGGGGGPRSHAHAAPMPAPHHPLGGQHGVARPSAQTAAHTAQSPPAARSPVLAMLSSSGGAGGATSPLAASLGPASAVKGGRTNGAVSKLRRTDEGVLALALCRDMLQRAGLKHSLTVFDVETAGCVAMDIAGSNGGGSGGGLAPKDDAIAGAMEAVLVSLGQGDGPELCAPLASAHHRGKPLLVGLLKVLSCPGAALVSTDSANFASTGGSSSLTTNDPSGGGGLARYTGPPPASPEQQQSSSPQVVTLLHAPPLGGAPSLGGSVESAGSSLRSGGSASEAFSNGRGYLRLQRSPSGRRLEIVPEASTSVDQSFVLGSPSFQASRGLRGAGDAAAAAAEDEAEARYKRDVWRGAVWVRRWLGRWGRRLEAKAFRSWAEEHRLEAHQRRGVRASKLLVLASRRAASLHRVRAAAFSRWRVASVAHRQGAKRRAAGLAWLRRWATRNGERLARLALRKWASKAARARQAATRRALARVQRSSGARAVGAALSRLLKLRMGRAMARWLAASRALARAARQANQEARALQVGLTTPPPLQHATCM